MTIKPLSEDDVMGAQGVDHESYIQVDRLKSLFAELAKKKIEMSMTIDMVDWKEIEKLFGPLVPK